MDTKSVYEYFGTQTAIARALGVSNPSVCNWGDKPPPLRQLQIERITLGKLRAEPEILDPRLKQSA
jgi:transcriptional repressor of cell division inhibition gene dicB